MKYRLVIVLFVILTIAGCATTKRSSVAFRTDSDGSMSVWDSTMSAAIVYNNGQMCMQRALAVKTVDSQNSIRVSEAILALSNAAVKAAADGKSNDLANISSTIKTTASLLTTTTERTSYLDFGMFYICQLAANGSLTDTQTAELVRILTVSGASMDMENYENISNPLTKLSMPIGDNLMVPKNRD